MIVLPKSWGFPVSFASATNSRPASSCSLSRPNSRAGVNFWVQEGVPMNVKRLALIAALVLTLAAPIPALAWGIAPTHYSILSDLLYNDGGLPAAITDHPQDFFQAAIGPDIAWTPLFSTTGRSYVHSFEFAASLLAVSKSDSDLAMAYAWGAHLAADATGEVSPTNPGGYIPEAEPLHELVEVAMDTVVFYTFPPPKDLSSWDQVDISFNADLLFRASIHYYQEVERVPLVWSWMADRALKTVKTTLATELDYIKLKQDACLSLAFLKSLADKGILPSADFIPYYNDSVDAAAAWITTGTVPLTHTPVPPSALLLGSGLLGLGLLGWRKTKS